MGLMKVRAEHFKKAGSTPSDAPIETLMICTAEKNTYRIKKTKILRHYICSINERI